MATTSDAPVLDTLAAMTIDSIERCGLDDRTLLLTRIAALAAMDAPAISYLAHVDPAIKAELTVEQLQDVLVAIAPVVGTARVMSAASHITQAFGVAIALAETEAEGIAEAEAKSRGGS
ncbi:carboxymuconolactone decarboxylase [Streptomyces pluripotens]|uniref:Carboxymuconolactone decarboxylase n=1 Tax=Streptomyces pluripotens TaxID=1355015 RepID=A0A221P5X7_9ACTN|nr:MULTISPECIES: carboxymuconolactone decarboxylase family protein [Streptomyces]ARP72946.1 carboxymuconolactone decarboxylase [Streptomyces pluripotens]ASN27195.1 carboxymuconolactone decarboxylase [Streptomyces pluripotens]KIE28801.1 carboxymuconolactone decarboxylase [Streptomyces sp. MUSC 125]MCH0557853.1 carboxymuconolactone decarboxylase family protein [Streptomyces sp. MUM 16J]